jgi:hypothetical protein
MPSIVKLKGSEIGVTTATNLNSAQLIRVYAATDALVTITDSDDNAIGSFTVPSGRVEYVEKEPSDQISANTEILCTSIAYNT